MNPMELTEKDFELLAEAISAWLSHPILAGTVEVVSRGMYLSPEKRELLSKEVIEAAIKTSAARKKLGIILAAKIELARQAAQDAAINAAEGGVR
jgi:hypothetical protein